MKRDDAVNFKFLTTRWETGWRTKDGEWKIKVRCVAREKTGTTHSAGRAKSGLETFEADAVAPQHEGVARPAPDVLERLARAGKDTERRAKSKTTAAAEAIGRAELGGTPGKDSGGQTGF